MTIAACLTLLLPFATPEPAATQAPGPASAAATQPPAPIRTAAPRQQVIPEAEASPPAALPTAVSERWNEWTRSLDVDQRVVGELLRFDKGSKGGLDPAYGRSLAGRIHGDLLASAHHQVARFQDGVCLPSFDVTFGAAALPAASGAARTERQKDFEDGLVRVEVVQCVPGPGVGSAEALRLYTDPDFRMEVEGRIRSIREEGDQSCVETNGVPALLAPSSACNRVRHFTDGAVASEHSQVISNGRDASLQVIYFKESLKTFVAIPGGVALHYVNYSRSSDLNRMTRWAAERSIRDGESRKAEALAARFRAAERATSAPPP